MPVEGAAQERLLAEESARLMQAAGLDAIDAGKGKGAVAGE